MLRNTQYAVRITFHVSRGAHVVQNDKINHLFDRRFVVGEDQAAGGDLAHVAVLQAGVEDLAQDRIGSTGGVGGEVGQAVGGEGAGDHAVAPGGARPGHINNIDV